MSEQRRTKSKFRWPFNKHRMGRIEAANSLAKQAGEVAETFRRDACQDRGSELWVAARRCARKFERAGSLYCQAGLCSAGVTAFLGAAKCWDFAGEAEHAAGCREAAKSIDVFYPIAEGGAGI